MVGDREIEACDCGTGKMACLEALLRATLCDMDDASVIVSSSTAVLDLAAALCAALGAQTARVDGATDPAQRHDIVTAFNAPHGRARVRLMRARRYITCLGLASCQIHYGQYLPGVKSRNALRAVVSHIASSDTTALMLLRS